VVDDPEIYGQIAAINSLNDIYAMGGIPLTALSVVCYPQKGDWDVLGQILMGGQKALNREGVVVLGGHSVDDQEIKFGYSVTGTVETKRVIRNSEAKEGDVLILTKPIGTGVISTAIKNEKASNRAMEELVKTMTTSAREASKLMVEARANACTDITGFGLLGHAYEMAKGSRVSFSIESEKIPQLPDVLNLIKQKMLTRGDKNNRIYVGDTVHFDARVTPEMQSALFDPQTAGGLLISIEESKASLITKNLEQAVIIGRVEALKDKLINVT
jgi:selenide,water dikinase